MDLVALNWQSLSSWIPVGLFTAILSFFSCSMATRLALRSGMLAQPGERQSHQLVTPTGGGLGLIFSLLIATLLLQTFLPLPGFWWQKILPGVVLLAVIGWLDDRQTISFPIRLLAQLIVSLWLVGFACFEGSWGDFSLCIVVVVALIWLMNLYNFMDGSNGMAGFQGVFVGLVMAGLFFTAEQVEMAMVALVVAAACSGFLPLNFPHARVFMGDVASVPLGFVFGSLAVYGIRTGAMDLASVVLAMSVFSVDASLTLAVRVFHGEQWYTAHNQHVYQRLIAQEWSHSQVLMVYQAINVILVLPAIVLVNMYPHFVIVTTGLILLVLGACWYIANLKLGALAARRLE